MTMMSRKEAAGQIFLHLRAASIVNTVIRRVQMHASACSFLPGQSTKCTMHSDGTAYLTSTVLLLIARGNRFHGFKYRFHARNGSLIPSSREKTMRPWIVLIDLLEEMCMLAGLGRSRSRSW